MTDNRTMTVSDEMIEAGVAAFDKTKTLSVRRLLNVAYPAMRALDPQVASLEAALERIRDAKSATKLQMREFAEETLAALQKDA